MLKLCLTILHDVLSLGLCPYERLHKRLNNLWLRGYTGIWNIDSFFSCCAKLWACSKIPPIYDSSHWQCPHFFYSTEPARTKRSQKPRWSRGSRYYCFFKYRLSFNHWRCCLEDEAYIGWVNHKCFQSDPELMENTNL